MEYIKECSTIDGGVNYMEISLPLVHKADFVTCLRNIKQCNIGHSERFCKEYMFRNLIYTINDKYDAKISKFDCKYVKPMGAGKVVAYYHKEKASFHTFPSMFETHTKSYVNAIVFKFHNRVYLNFEEREYDDGETSYRIFINYNHEDAVDLPNISQRVQHALEAVTSALARRE
jgi:hypothetical protein